MTSSGRPDGGDTGVNRRSFLGMLLAVSLASLLPWRKTEAKVDTQGEFIIVNGWVVPKKWLEKR